MRELQASLQIVTREKSILNTRPGICVRNCVSGPGHSPYNEHDAEAREDTVKSTEARLTGWQIVLISQATFRSSVGACQSVPRWMNDSVYVASGKGTRAGSGSAARWKKSATIFALLPESSLGSVNPLRYTREMRCSIVTRYYA